MDEQLDGGENEFEIGKAGRLAMFLRSVSPRDPWQLTILVGTIFLFVSPRLSWFPEKLLDAAHTPLSRPIRTDFGSLASGIIGFLCLVTFAGIASYFCCFWSGPRPVRRILLLVLLPGILGVSLVAAAYVWFFLWPESLFANHPAFSLVYKWLVGNFMQFPPGFHLALLALLILAAYTVCLHLGLVSLPISFLPQSAHTDQGPAAWRNSRRLIFFLLCMLFLIARAFSISFSFPYEQWPRFKATIYGQAYAWILGVLEAGMPIGIALLILGRPAYGVARSLFKLPNWKFAVLGLFLPLTISLAISGLGYGADNARWASNDFGKYNQPLFSTYFNVALLMNGSLLFAAFSAFAEELVFRGWLLRNLTQRFGLSAGIFFAGMIWAAYHFHSDVHFRYSVQNTVVQLGLRTAVCVSMNYGLAWITLRSRSLIPAGILHTASNILIESGINLPTPWSRELRILIWCIVALVLFRYWPVTEEFSAKQGRPSSVAAALANE